MARVSYGLKEFQRDPITHVVIPLLIEFLSQFMFTFWGVMTERPQFPTKSDNVTNVSPLNSAESDYMQKYFVPAFQSGIGVWLCIMLYSRMSYTPAQFNPAVSTTFAVVGTLPPLMLVPNIIAQCLASLLAAYVSQLIRGAPPAALIIPEHVGSFSIFMNEVIMVGSLTILVAELTQNPKMADVLGALGVGMTVFMCLLCGPWMGVICLSTSRAFGPAVLMGGRVWDRYWLLWVADLTGAVLSGIFWLMFLAPPNRSWLGRFIKKNPLKDDILMEEKNSNEDE